MKSTSANESASSDKSTKGPAKKLSATAIKSEMKKLPKTIFSPATGTNTSDPFPSKDLEQFRQLIMEAREQGVEELEELNEQLRDWAAQEGSDDNSYSLHMAEQGTDAMEREKTFLQAQRTSDYVKKLEEALQRVSNGTFGICRVCGLRLDSKRLLAVPVTQVCTVYKNTSKPCEPGKKHLELQGEDPNSRRA